MGASRACLYTFLKQARVKRMIAFRLHRLQVTVTVILGSVGPRKSASCKDAGREAVCLRHAAAAVASTNLCEPGSRARCPCDLRRQIVSVMWVSCGVLKQRDLYTKIITQPVVKAHRRHPHERRLAFSLCIPQALIAPFLRPRHRNAVFLKLSLVSNARLTSVLECTLESGAMRALIS